METDRLSWIRRHKIDKFQAIHSFWSSFGIDAYDESTVPAGEYRPELPYITYDATLADFDESVYLHASIWYYGTSWTEITAKLKEIEDDIGRGGKIIPCDGGAIWIAKWRPFAQRMPDPNDMVRRIYLNLVAEFIIAE